MLPWIAFGGLIVLALAHSVLGEKEILQPLFADKRWKTSLPRAPFESLLRFAWHLTSIAWVAMAAMIVDVDVTVAVGLGALASGMLVFVSLRGHLAWPIFFAVAIAALAQGGHVPQWVLFALLGSAAAVAVVAGAIHVYWAFGGRRGFARALPAAKSGQPAFTPGPLSCLAVTAALGVFAALLWVVPFGPESVVATGALWVAFAVLVVRAVGDTKQVGFSKTDRSSAFALDDDRLFTPLVVVLAAGAGTALFLL